MGPMRSLLIAIAAVFGLGLASAQAQSPAPAATTKTDLMLYTSQPQDMLNAMISVFNRSHPEITVHFFRSGTTEVMNKLEAEYAAGAPQPDLLLVANALDLSQMKAKDRLLAYPEAPTAGYDPAIHDPDHRYFATKRITTGIAYNTKLVQDPPKSWKDLLDRRFKGQVIMPSPLYSGAAALHVGTMTASPAFGWAYYEALAENGALAGRGNGSVMEAVASGQSAVGIIVDFMALNAKAKGSPVDFVFPSDGVSVITEPVAILKTARNPAGAKVFIDWLLSAEGQAFAAEQGYLPALPGVAAPKTFPAGFVDPLLISVDPEILIKDDEQTKRTFSDLFGG
ncbi:extracellular solute-binding protein, family 1 [Rhodospirillum rubrum ATCC 11170]|uniref:Extracellular solute-binding protein, family 1 n=2 Tax=Rhodospirillum rubrum TaxID=1085 RepID=Q2RPF1_RHORT|nr:extracellular solute-binding protein, family 1 [Rhodospirillum rubrum ATCC 11170]MBK5955678.1 ABC transporter substrate-binding protein [Rhodospirillum rubrum]HCF19534.1 ABC transporter substrate-binding protein [Rhodospirillum rubrum]